jgi:hypothetical protein
LFCEAEAEAAAEPIPGTAVTGMRVLLVGGTERQIPPIREYLESHGVQLLHEDGPGAAELVTGVHIVVLWTRYVSHPTAFALKRECRVRDVPIFYWTRTSPVSLIALIAAARSSTALDAVEASVP